MIPMLLALLSPALATPDPIPTDAHHRLVGFDAEGRALVTVVRVRWTLDHELSSGDVEPTGPVATTSVSCHIVRPLAGAGPALDAEACRRAAPRFDRGRPGNGETLTIGVMPPTDPVWLRVKDGRVLAFRPSGDRTESGKLVTAEVVGIEREARLLRVPMQRPDPFGNPVTNDVWAILHPDLPRGDDAVCLSVRPGTRGGTIEPTMLAAIQEAVGADWVVRGATPVRNTRTEPELLYRGEVLADYASEVQSRLEPMVAIESLQPFPEAECPLTLVLP